jgi:hypothetical protein
MSLAMEVHGGQRRAGTEIPYLAHLLVVGGLVIEDGGNEDEAIAALLHDAVEDGGGRPMLEGIGRRFGPDIATIVEGCTDNLDHESDEDWVERKRRYLAHLPAVQDGRVLRVCLADKVHNARSIVRDYRESGSALWERFAQKTARDQLWYYSGLLEYFSACRPGPLTEDLWRAVGELAWLVANDEAQRSDRVRLWLDPDLHNRQAPEEWIQVRTPDEAIQLLEKYPVQAISLDDGGEAPKVITWLAELDAKGGPDRWPSGKISFHGEPAPAAVRQLAAALQAHTGETAP